MAFRYIHTSNYWISVLKSLSIKLFGPIIYGRTMKLLGSLLLYRFLCITVWFLHKKILYQVTIKFDFWLMFTACVLRLFSMVIILFWLRVTNSLPSLQLNWVCRLFSYYNTHHSNMVCVYFSDWRRTHLFYAVLVSANLLNWNVDPLPTLVSPF